MKPELGIVLFTSDKGHFGRKDIYKYTVNSITKQLENDFDLKKFAHIKSSGCVVQQEKEAEKIAKDLRALDFTTAITAGNWSHNDSSHATGYTEDIIRTFSEEAVLENQYSIWLEDDWILKGDPVKWVNQSLDILKYHPEILAVRANHGTELPEGEGAWETFPRRHKESDILRQGPNYTNWGPTFTFQPTVVRTRDVFQAYRIVRSNWEHFRNEHIELTSGIAMKVFSDSEMPFLFANPQICHSIHIGEPDFEKRANL
jgi:hypothetical protein